MLSSSLFCTMLQEFGHVLYFMSIHRPKQGRVEAGGGHPRSEVRVAQCEGSLSEWGMRRVLHLPVPLDVMSV